MTKITAKLRPAPDEPSIHARLPPEVRQYMNNMRDWAREVQQVIAQMETAITELQKSVFP